ncbi:zinc finger protein ZFP2 isoform X2 [Tenrec ecaudatus]|uniref:zinc finger protein ZFP2 isoform X2 n=1 Tax=Tenrec ecaudatus TaxID=94439 RepID=UPI003F5A77C5
MVRQLSNQESGTGGLYKGNPLQPHTLDADTRDPTSFSAPPAPRMCIGAPARAPRLYGRCSPRSPGSRAAALPRLIARFTVGAVGKHRIASHKLWLLYILPIPSVGPLRKEKAMAAGPLSVDLGWVVLAQHLVKKESEVSEVSDFQGRVCGLHLGGVIHLDSAQRNVCWKMMLENYRHLAHWLDGHLFIFKPLRQLGTISFIHHIC